MAFSNIADFNHISVVLWLKYYNGKNKHAGANNFINK